KCAVVGTGHAECTGTSTHAWATGEKRGVVAAASAALTSRKPATRPERMMTQQFRTLVLLTAIAGVMTACRKKPETQTPPATPPQTPTNPTVSNPPAPPPPTTPTGPTEAEIRAAIEAVKTNITATIYF